MNDTIQQSSVSVAVGNAVHTAKDHWHNLFITSLARVAESYIFVRDDAAPVFRIHHDYQFRKQSKFVQSDPQSGGTKPDSHAPHARSDSPHIEMQNTGSVKSLRTGSIRRSRAMRPTLRPLPADGDHQRDRSQARRAMTVIVRRGAGRAASRACDPWKSPTAIPWKKSQSYQALARPWGAGLRSLKQTKRYWTVKAAP